MTDPFWLLAAADIVDSIHMLCGAVLVFVLPLSLVALANLDDMPPGPARRLPYAGLLVTAVLALLATLTPSPKTLQAAALAAATDPATRAVIAQRINQTEKP